MADTPCPYCESVFENKEELSKHIDRIHHGSGLLEGDTRKQTECLLSIKVSVQRKPHNHLVLVTNHPWRKVSSVIRCFLLPRLVLKNQ